jgi:hypothetical protein
MMKPHVFLELAHARFAEIPLLLAVLLARDAGDVCEAKNALKLALLFRLRMFAVLVNDERRSSCFEIQC